MIHIACCLDNAFTSHCGILIVSICENRGLEPIYFHLLTDGLDASNEKLLKDIVARYGQLITVYKIDKKDLGNCPIRKNDHVSIATYFRILLPLLIPESISKILYLDCDIVVLKNLDCLWNINIDDHAVGVILDMFNHDVRIYNRLDYDMSLEYFNAGVLLVNLDFWRVTGLSSEVLDYINENPEKLKFWDQDALNYVLKDKKVNIPLRFNVQDGFYWKDPFVAKKCWKEMYEAAADPVVLHYTGHIKPWYKECDHPRKDLYMKYKSLSPWKHQKIGHLRLLLRVRCLILKLLIGLGIMSSRSNYR